MTKVIVTETFTRVYEVEVDIVDEMTIQHEIDKRACDLVPRWVGTSVVDEDGGEVYDY
jgi:hypothetical protein